MKVYKTQNDVCGSEVRLDYQSLITSVSIGMGHCKESIRRYMSKLDYMTPPDPVKIKLTTRRLADEAYRLALIGETMSALLYGLRRDTVTIVNREAVSDG